MQKEYTHGITLKNGQTHYPTLKELSKKHNVTLTSLQNQSSRNDWTQKREEAKMEMEKVVLVEAVSQDVPMRVSVFDVECVNSKLLNVVKKKLEKIEDDLIF